MATSQQGSNVGDIEERIRLFTAADREWRHDGPTPEAVRAFGVREADLRRLQGGQGQAWTDGRLVLKPVGCAPGGRADRGRRAQGDGAGGCEVTTGSDSAAS